MAFLTALVAGFLLGAGLLLSRMCDPERVLGFLDVAGAWNPALALTMGGAVLVATPAFFWVRTRGRNCLGIATALPDRFTITGRLIGGSAIFGLGWGLSGICPGPSLLILTAGSAQAWVFAGGLLAGFFAAGYGRGEPR
jgi:uncharacterized membrane protein YedE/YeeE